MTADLPAWTNAAAACIQAIGSVAAIYYAVRIARKADARAAAAEKAADARAAQAEALAFARAQEAERKARQLYLNENLQRRIAPLRSALNALDFIEGPLNSALIEKVEIGMHGPFDKARFDRDTVTHALDRLEKLVNEMPTAEASLCLEKLIKDVRVLFHNPSISPRPNLPQALLTSRDTLMHAFEQLRHVERIYIKEHEVALQERECS